MRILKFSLPSRGNLTYARESRNFLRKILVGALVSTSVMMIPVSQASASSPVGTNRNVLVTNGAGGDLAFALANAADNDAVMVAAALGGAGSTDVAKSVGLLAANAASASGSALTQTATVRAGGVLSLYAFTATSIAIAITGGTFSASATSATTLTATPVGTTASALSATGIAFTSTAAASGTARTASVLWTAPSTAGTYTINMYRAASGETLLATNAAAGTLEATITVTVVTTSGHPLVGGTNAAANRGTVNASMFTAVASNTGANAVVLTAGSEIGAGEDAALSKGLIVKDSTNGTAQTATVLSGATLSLYALVSTTAAFTASGGSFSGSVGGPSTNPTATYSDNLRTTLLTGATSSALKQIATLWTAPTTVGTYTVSLYVGDGTSVPSLAVPGVTLAGNMTVTVVASSAGGAYSAAYSACNTATTSSSTITGVDSTGSVSNGGSWYIDFDLDDIYDQDLDTGNVVATATNGALVNLGTAGASVLTGTASTDVERSAGVGATVRISQGTADAPVTTTVTITYNGTTVCTKTVTIAGKVAKIVVSNVGTQKLSGQSTDNTYQWTYQTLGTGKTGGSLFAVLATDSAGNLVATDGIGTFSADAATLTTTVQAISVNHQSSSVSSSSLDRYAYGSWTCGAVAGEANVKIKFTTTASGESVSSDAFKARCAGDAYTYALSFDKATYTQGEIATATVKFLDSKGFAANSITAPGANTWVLPYMTGVTIGTLASGASAAAVTKADGTSSYIFTVGTTSGVTAGTYTGVVEWTALAAGTKQTPTYKIVTGGDTTTNADVLKSIVALIASINKQIQALQKLILKR
jgi:hypothetical protein